MKSVVCLVGRPNVGKSTLFNALTGTRDALVYDMPGTTRDRQYGEVKLLEPECDQTLDHAFEKDPMDDFEDESTPDVDAAPQARKIVVIDTGGLTSEKEGIDELMQQQVRQAIEESQLVLFVVDAKARLNAEDARILKELRKFSTKILLVVNKIDGLKEDQALLDFYEFGLDLIGISAAHRQGLKILKERIAELLPKEEIDTEEDKHLKKPGAIKVAIVGRPNVGKSTLTNRLLGEDRVVVYDMPGTTRDSIYIPFERMGKDYVFIDTAGVRRRARVDGVLEKFSIVKTLSSIADANVVLILLDATESVVDQDLHLIGFALDAGKGVVIAVNKWDHLPEDQKNWVKSELDRKLAFVESFVDIHFISAKHGTGVGKLYPSLDLAYESGRRELSTNDINNVLEAAMRDHQPPMGGLQRIKIRFGHLGGHEPLQIIIHGNQLDKLVKSYQRYLIGCFRKAFQLRGVPIKMIFKSGKNPFAPKKFKRLKPREGMSKGY
jgi:GTP-binding protein